MSEGITFEKIEAALTLERVGYGMPECYGCRKMIRGYELPLCLKCYNIKEEGSKDV